MSATIVFVLAVVSAWAVVSLLAARVLGAMIHLADRHDSARFAAHAPSHGHLP